MPFMVRFFAIASDDITDLLATSRMPAFFYRLHSQYCIEQLAILINMKINLNVFGIRGCQSFISLRSLKVFAA